ncbi:UNVERIFIED_CONTAM: putative late blight resistance proteinR1C-3 [Sesamum calycinum]|uniref:Late blight resistance proteinR1C-3 n=1 Tax=Sesamum calycinum TaxID=2727403 RepID=A0AAW2SXV4_9LAMI
MFPLHGRFPEDYSIPISKLTKLCVAEGFLKPIRPKSLEELAEEYLEDLVKRNLVLNIKMKSNGKIKLCGLHDLLRNLCIQKAQEQEFLHVVNTSAGVMEKHCRMSINPVISREFVDTYAFPSPICSILYFHSYIASSSFIQGYRLLGLWEMSQLRHLIFHAISISPNPLPHLQVLENLQTLSVLKFQIHQLFSRLRWSSFGMNAKPFSTETNHS